MRGYSIHILPSLNRDGFLKAKRGDCSSTAGMRNANGIDLENDFRSDPDEHAQVESDNVKKWMNEKQFILSIDLSGQDENIHIPKIHGDKSSNAEER